MNPAIEETSVDRLRVALGAQQVLLDFYVRKHLPPSLWAAFDPSDVVQDVFIEALRRSAQFQEMEDDRKPRWLLTIARNRITYLLRRHRASRRVDHQPESDGSEGTLVVLLEELAVYERTPSTSAASHEAYSAVRHSIKMLSPDYAAALQSRYFEGQSPRLMAENTGKTENAIHQLCHRALSALRTELGTRWIPTGIAS
jgi:RNA polymerase sigma factor (sigma-70 family)